MQCIGISFLFFWYSFLRIVEKCNEMKRLSLPVCLAFVALSIGCGDAANEPSTDATETTMETPAADTDNTMSIDTSAANAFMVEAASGGLMEVELGRYASDNASSPQVKAFGQMMVKDHSNANEDLKALAARKNVTLPTAPNEKHQEIINNLKQKKGTEFDKAYVEEMVKAHENDVAKFQSKATEGDDADVVTFAAKTLPVLKSHLDQVKKLHENMKK